MRIVSLLPSSTEIVFALGKGAQVVGRSHECDFPPDAAPIPAVTADFLPSHLPAASIDAAVARGRAQEFTIYRLDQDALRACEPDVILSQSLCGVRAVPSHLIEEAATSLPKRPLVVGTDPHTLEDVLQSFITIGVAVGAEAEGRALAARIRSRLHWLAAVVSDRDRPRVAVLEWPDPIYTGGHWVPDMVDWAGGSAVLGTAGVPSRRIGIDDLGWARPDVVVLAFCGFDLYQAQARVRQLTAHPGWQEATRHARVVAIDGSSYLSRPGPRLIQGIELLAWVLHQPHSSLRPAVGRGALLIEAGWVDVSSLPVLAEAPF